VRIRPATNADGAALRTLIFGVLGEFGLTPDPSGTDADLDDLACHYAGGAFDVLVDGERLIGSVGLAPIDQGVCELRKMYLDAEYRGRGQGRRLLTHAIARARGLGFQRIELETASVLQRAIALYAAFGFQPTERSVDAGRCDQVWALELATDRAQ
jgi:putative acetyltransferase